MTDRVILKLSPGWYVMADDNQWMLATGPGKPVDARLRAAETRYRPVGYVGGRKATLERLASEKGVPVTAQAQQVIDSWPDTFLAWRRQHAGKVAA